MQVAEGVTTQSFMKLVSEIARVEGKKWIPILVKFGKIVA